MLSNTFKTEIENYSFTKQGINSIKDCGDKGEDWPVVYILSGDKEAYVGETQSAFQRMTQHLANPKRKQLTKISLMLSDSFNKSAILDIENMLITHMHADGKFILQNSNGGTLTQEALATSAKLKMAEPSGFVIPQKCRIKATA